MRKKSMRHHRGGLLHTRCAETPTRPCESIVADTPPPGRPQRRPSGDRIYGRGAGSPQVPAVVARGVVVTGAGEGLLSLGS